MGLIRERRERLIPGVEVGLLPGDDVVDDARREVAPAVLRPDVRRVRDLQDDPSDRVEDVVAADRNAQGGEVGPLVRDRKGGRVVGAVVLPRLGLDEHRGPRIRIGIRIPSRDRVPRDRRAEVGTVERQAERTLPRQVEDVAGKGVADEPRDDRDDVLPGGQRVLHQVSHGARRTRRELLSDPIPHPRVGIRPAACVRDVEDRDDRVRRVIDRVRQVIVLGVTQ